VFSSWPDCLDDGERKAAETARSAHPLSKSQKMGSSGPGSLPNVSTKAFRRCKKALLEPGAPLGRRRAHAITPLAFGEVRLIETCCREVQGAESNPVGGPVLGAVTNAPWGRFTHIAPTSKASFARHGNSTMRRTMVSLLAFDCWRAATLARSYLGLLIRLT